MGKPLRPGHRLAVTTKRNASDNLFATGASATHLN